MAAVEVAPEEDAGCAKRIPRGEEQRYRLDLAYARRADPGSAPGIRHLRADIDDGQRRPGVLDALGGYADHGRMRLDEAQRPSDRYGDFLRRPPPPRLISGPKAVSR